MKKIFNSIFNKLNCGNIKAESYIVMGNGEKISPDYNIFYNENAKTASLKAEYNDTLRDSIFFDFSEDYIICRRVFENISGEDISVKELLFSLSGIKFEGKTDDDYYYHIENPRVYGNNTFPVDYNKEEPECEENKKFGLTPGNRWPDMGKVDEPLPDRIGSSLFQPFPAILVSNYNVKKGLVHGTLSQDVFYHNYDISHSEDAVTLDIYSSFMDIDALLMESGRVIIDEWYLGYTDEADDIEKIFAGYSDVLRKKLPVMYGRSDINRTSVVWGSWNDGLWRNISEDVLLDEARYLKENLPTVKWFQVDDGYAVNNMCLGLGMPYSGGEELDANKFPNGMRHYSDAVREVGLRPAIWMGGKCPYSSKIHQEHPEWFINYKHIFNDSSPLDVSREDVREYMKKAIKTMFMEYGFDAMKLDFWSHPFEDRFDLLSDKRKSGYEWRKWWLKELRDVLPTDGYLQTACDIAMANPFLGEYGTNYRYGIDISAGNWNNVKLAILWGINCFATHTGDLFVPNSDSIGLLPGLTEKEAMFVINFCLVTHSMVEIAGQLSKSNDTHRLNILKKAICNPNNGQDVYFVNYDYRAKATKSMPEIMYFKTPHFSRIESNEAMPIVTVGLFNIEEENKVIKVKCSELGLDNGTYTFTNVWTGEQITLTDELCVEIEPHSSALFAVNKEEGIQLYDANIRVNRLCVEENSVRIETDYSVKGAELTFNRIPSKLMLEKEEVPFVINSKTVIFDADKKGVLEIRF